MGLRNIDRVPKADLYYALPNFSWESTLSYVCQIESDAVVNGAEINLTSRMSSAKKREMRAIEDARNRSVKEELVTVTALQEEVESDIKIIASLNEEQRKYVDEILEKLLLETNEAASGRNHLTSLTSLLQASDDELNQQTERANVLHDLFTDRNALDRSLILTDKWHTKNPEACSHLFGFHSFHEYKCYCKCLFEFIDLKFGEMKTDKISEWEKISIAKLRMRRGLSLTMLGLIYDRNRTSIGIYVSFGAAKWGVAGEILSILDLTKEYLDYERPQIFTDASHQSVSVLVDGKDFMTDDPKKNSAIKRAMWSDKINHVGARIISWSTPSGLTVEHTSPIMARASESAIVALWGSYWDTVSLTKVPDEKPMSLKYSIVEKYEENCPLLKQIVKENKNNGNKNNNENDDENNDSDNSDEDDIINKQDEESDDENVEPQIKRRSDPINLTNRWKKFLGDIRLRALKTDNGHKYSMIKVKEMAGNLLKAGPNESSTRKLQQLEVHEALHNAYSTGRLKKCLLSYYLNKMEPLRTDMLRHLRGEAGEDLPPRLLTRLAKFPTGTTVLADRGFYFDAPSYPNVPDHATIYGWT